MDSFISLFPCKIRYLENQIREVFGLQGTPIRITIRQKGDKEDD